MRAYIGARLFTMAGHPVYGGISGNAQGLTFLAPNFLRLRYPPFTDSAVLLAIDRGAAM
jgi:hypothetical protein